MGHLKLVVDHQKIDYSGPFQATNLFRTIEAFLFERGFDKKQDKDFEQNLPNGRFIEWQISPWKKVSDYIRYIIKVRVLCYDLVKRESAVGKKKVKFDTGRVIIVIDGFMELDSDNRWESRPMLFFIRTMFDYFINKVYTERFEQVLIHDINHLNEEIEKFFNIYRSYKSISRRSM